MAPLPAAPAASPPTTLPVVETFHSLQGEGFHAGRGAFFIRLGGCSVGCPWCDTKHSWLAAAHPRRSPRDLAAAATAAEAGAAFVVITGGEPLQHRLDDLCAAIAAGRPELPLHLETSGVHKLSGRFAWITLSPKPHHPPTRELLAACQELKVVVHGPDDLAFAETMAAAARRRGGATSPLLLLQPGWDSPRGQELAVNYVRHHPDWRLSLQSHKWLGVR